MITLPWPPKELNPNARVHRMVKAKYAAVYKQECWAIAKQSGVVAPKGNIHLKIIFYTPNKQRRDLDNMHSAMKSGLDGVALALGIDDQRFRPVTLDVANIIGGMVKIELYPARCGEEESRLAHNQETDGANPSTATKHMGIA